MVKASVIIPNWNGRPLLEECLSALINQTFRDFEIIIVDNGSTDDSINFIKTSYPKVKVIELDKNYGFARAINAGVKESKSKYVVLLNNDTRVDKDWLKNLIITAENHPEVISVNSKLLNYYDQKKIDGVGIQINEVGQARSIGWNEVDQGQYEKEVYIFGATGGASLFRRLDFIKVGLFDGNFFMYSEEVDLAFRAQFLGFKSIYCPKAIVFHKHKASSKKFPAKLEYWQFLNMTQVIIKDYPSQLLLKRWRLLKISLVHFNTILYQVKSGFFLPPIMVELWLIWHLPGLIQSRSTIQKSIKIDLDEIEQFLYPKPITFWGVRPSEQSKLK